MFVTVAVLSAAVAALLYVRWRASLRDGWSARRPMPRVSFGLLAAVVLITGFTTWRHDSLEQRLSRAASALAGFSVTVHCQSLAGEAVDMSGDAGSVNANADGSLQHATLIRREQCGALHDYLSHHGRKATQGQVIAVHVLTHETMHMRGIRDEAAAECAAVQRDAQMARILGASARDARVLALTYWIAVYPDTPDGYTSTECRRDGELDEHLPDGWPAGPSSAS